MVNYFKKYCEAHDSALSKLEITSIDGCEITHECGFDTLCAFSAKLAENGC